ncbi:MAG: T9SS type A sorting domain-containing protein [Phaeodactylibacter sp.]|nr:T9SS type A sorting domain-containing protein [Phaeodactylibacter sp.]MCB9296794.1 T9SS type A sorting domain-containing protein [Lewinellaceae bacterium]
MKKIKFCLFYFLLTLSGLAQNWAPLGYGLEYPAFTMFADSLDNKLYIGGNFKYAFNSEEDTVSVNGITAWDGSQYLALGGGNSDGNCTVVCPPMRSITRFGNDIFANFQDVPLGNDTIYGIARWDGERWEALQGGLRIASGYGGSFSASLEVEDGILVGGLFTQAGNVPADGLAKWDGHAWEAFDFPGYGFDSRIMGLARLGGDIYAAGNFSAITEEGDTDDIARFDGEKWHAVDGGIRGGLGHVNAMLVFQGELYVAGFFQKSAGNAGNKIMKLGTSGWQEVGGGIIGANADIHAMAIHNGALYVGGIFDWVGDGVPAQNLARWDGQQWCGFGSDFNLGRVLAIESLNDTLFVAGGFRYIDSTLVNGIAKWVGGDFTANCGATNGTDSTGPASISLFPNPAAHTLYLQLNSFQAEKATLAIHNAAGQLQHQEQVELSPQLQQHQVDVSAWPPGVYFLRLRAGGRQAVRRFVKTG